MNALLDGELLGRRDFPPAPLNVSSLTAVLSLTTGFAKERHHQVTDFLYFVCQKEPAAIKEPSQETGNEAIVSFLSSQPRQDGRLCPPHFLDPAADLAWVAI